MILSIILFKSIHIFMKVLDSVNGAKTMTASASLSAPPSLTERTEALLQNAILAGQLQPGSRLALPALSEQFGVGATPLREALSRLVSRGLVTLSDNKGFRVASISYEDLHDITESRILIEKAALARAFERKDGEWEDRVAASTHRLLRIIRKDDTKMLEGSAEYDSAHKDFHAAVISGCGLPRLMAVQSSLYDAAYRYRRIVGHNRLTRDYAYEIHRRLADLVLAYDMAAAVDELENHLRITIEVVYHDIANHSSSA
jgi:DNA-binding GntR family transcriptional regulator